MIKELLTMSATMLAMDLIWIKTVMKGLYVRHVPGMLRLSGGQVDIHPWATVAVYAVMLAGLYYFAVRPSDSLKEALFSGAMAGLFSYGTFALTNHALFKDWAWQLTLGDMVWGTFMMSLVAAIGFFVRG